MWQASGQGGWVGLDWEWGRAGRSKIEAAQFEQNFRAGSRHRSALWAEVEGAVGALGLGLRRLLAALVAGGAVLAVVHAATLPERIQDGRREMLSRQGFWIMATKRWGTSPKHTHEGGTATRVLYGAREW
jgi:hypothetical protein